MTIDELKKEIIKACEFGLRGPEIPAKLVANNVPFHLVDLSLVTVLDDMVEAKDLVEIEYVLPSIPYRAKSLYFPAGTRITVSQ